MDNNEYKLRMQQLLKMLDMGKFSSAAKLADSLNWRSINNVRDLNIIAESYRKAKNFEQEHEVLLLSYSHSKRGRTILENLVKCAINLKNFEMAIEYYNEYIRMFPHDEYKYYMKFLLYKAQGAGFQDQISVLEDYCHYARQDEVAMFELAYLYHLEGMVKKCVDMCDDIILWFGNCDESRKAMELKMRYVPLNELQLEKYRQKHDSDIQISNIKNYEPKNMANIENITVPSYDPNDFEGKLQADLSKSVMSLMNNDNEMAVGGYVQNNRIGIDNGKNADTSNLENVNILKPNRNSDIIKNPNIENVIEDINIPGQMNLEEIMAKLKDKKDEALSNLEKMSYSTAENPFLNEKALLRARTKELEIQQVLSDKKIQKPNEKPPVNLSNTQSFNIMKTIEQDLANLVWGTNILTKTSDEVNTQMTVDNKTIQKMDDENTKVNILPEVNTSINEQINEQNPKFENRQMVEDIKLNIDEISSNEDNMSFNDNYEVNKEQAKKYVQNFIMGENSEDMSISNDENHYQLNEMQNSVLGYFSTIVGFDKTLAKAIHFIMNGKRYLAISSLSGDNRIDLSKKLLEAAFRQMGNKNLKISIATGSLLNDKNIMEVFEKIDGGFLIIDEASNLTVPTVDAICSMLILHKDTGIVMCDAENELKNLLNLNPKLNELLEVRMHLPVLTNKELSAFGNEYAQKCGYKLTDKAKKAICATIGNLQKGELIVTVSDIKNLIDKTIAKKENSGFSFFAKMKSSDNANILDEKDFI